MPLNAIAVGRRVASSVPFLAGCVMGALLTSLLWLNLRRVYGAAPAALAPPFAAPEVLAPRDVMLHLPQFTHVCRNSVYNCLGIARADAVALCAPSGGEQSPPTAGDATPAAALARQAERRGVYWRDQISSGGARQRGVDIMGGWLEAGDAAATSVLLQLQARELGVHGHLCEIGVHHGKYLIWLALHAQAGERAVGLDLFEAAQAENLDRSGQGSLALLRANAARYAAEGAVEGIPINSLRLPLCFFHEQHLQGVRFFSVDGGHFVDHAYEDCWSAWSSLGKGGIIAVDDFLHGVQVLQGTLRFLNAASDARAFLIGSNKIYICHRDFYDVYVNALRAAFPRLRHRTQFGASPQLVLPPHKALTLHGWLISPVLEPDREVWHCGLLNRSTYTPPDYTPRDLTA